MSSLKLLLTCTILCVHLSLFATVTLTSTVTNNKCYNGTSGTIVGSASGGSSGQYEYRLATGPAAGWLSSATFTALAAGTYPLSARDKSNTSDIATIFVTVGQPTNIAVSSTVTNTSCASSADGVVALTVSGGTSPYSYTWTKNGTSISGATAASISGLLPGVYNAIVTDANGCAQQLTNATSTAIIPLTLTGFNQDVVADGTNTSTSTNTTVTSPMDLVNTSGSTTVFGGTNFYELGFKTSSGSTAFSSDGLPTTGSITSAKDNTHQFVLADYSASNDLYLNGTSSTGTLTLSTASIAPYQNLYILSTSGNGTSTVNYSVKYSDNTTSTGSLSVTDWASGTANIALGTLSRVYYKVQTANKTTSNAGTKDAQGNIFALYDLPISIAANNKNVVSITFTNSTATQANIFAITGSTSSTGVAVAAGGSASVTPSVAISSNPGNQTYCSGETFTFIAAPTNAGSNPTYTWTVGGITQTSSTSSMTATVSGTGSKTIAVTMTVTDASATCLTSQTATKSIVLTSGTVTPAVSVTGPTSVCQGTSTTYIATPVNGGASPVYTWYVNNSAVSGYTDSTFNTTLGTGANTVYAKLASSVSCATSNPTTSTNTISTTVNATVTPSVSISGKSTSSSTVLFSISSSANLGTSPSYQWYLNGNSISGATSSTYTATSPAATDYYSLAATSAATCPSNAQVMSNYVNANTILPITLTLFKATLQSINSTLLTWHTSTEVNAKIFEIQRTESAANNFITIGTVAAQNAVNGATYNYLDALTTNGNYFYRLKSIDIDGTYTYSDIVAITFNKGATTSIMAYPNPFTDELRVQVSAAQNVQNAKISLYNSTGAELFITTKNIITGTQIIDIQNLNKFAAGIYILKVNGAGIENTGIKIIKK